MPELTARQRECLEGVLQRKTAKQIGRELGITHHAVEKHLLAARQKLGAADTLEAARIYAQSTTTVEPYYGPPEVSDSPDDPSFEGQPKREALRLRDVATEGPTWLQTLSQGQTLVAIGLCGIGMIVILSLIIAVANGAAQLGP